MLKWSSEAEVLHGLISGGALVWHLAMLTVDEHTSVPPCLLHGRRDPTAAAKARLSRTLLHRSMYWQIGWKYGRMFASNWSATAFAHTAAHHREMCTTHHVTTHHGTTMHHTSCHEACHHGWRGCSIIHAYRRRNRIVRTQGQRHIKEQRECTIQKENRVNAPSTKKEPLQAYGVARGASFKENT